MSDEPGRLLEDAAQINRLIVDLWVATEKSGPRYDDFALTSQQHAVLTLIITEPEMTPRRLADRLGVTKGAISQHLGVLEKEGYIVRRRNEQDKRVQVLLLQDKGERYQQSLRQFERYSLDRYLTKLSPQDLAEIVAALTKLKNAFAE